MTTRIDLCHGTPPLTARTAPWMDRLLGDADECRRLLAEFGSPVNVLDFSPLRGHVEALTAVASAEGVHLGVFAARKANKTVGVVTAAQRAGIGVDVASLRELQTALDTGIAPDRVIVTAAVKPRALLEAAIGRGCIVSADDEDEYLDILDTARALSLDARIALRLAIVHSDVPPTRFGSTPERWLDVLGRAGTDGVRIEGLHFHLNGYAVADRAHGIVRACAFAADLRAAGHDVAFVDIGGGFPVRYLDDEGQWRAFWRRLADDPGAVTWRGDDLGLEDATADRPSSQVYPFWQSLDAAAWLGELLATAVDGTTVAERLREADLDLHCEPGRALLDGCGLSLAAVAFRKETSDGLPIIGLHMNRTQLRSTSRDVLLDPVWIRPDDAAPPSDPQDGFLVGAYCIEEELLLRRRLRFPAGVSRDDLIAFPNTGGYLMHILESPSHQIPLARNVVRGPDGWALDPVDVA